jgi:Holliday junction resolvasome RuvABC endonuclease subunit
MPTRFISIDPSTTFTGWAVFQDQGLVTWGKIDTRGADYAGRFQLIVEELAAACNRYGAREIVIEDVKFAWHGVERQRNIAGLQVVFRSVKDWAGQLQIPFKAVNPATWKNAVVGWNRASKQQTKDNILSRFPSLPVNLSEHEYDAIAIGVYYSGLKNLENMVY